MSKKIKINEQQLSVLVNYIKEGEIKPNLNEGELLEEGKLANWVMVGLAALGTMAGSAQSKSKVSNMDSDTLITQAEKVQNVLKTNPEASKLFSDAAKELNIKNLDALKQINTKDNKNIEIFKTKNLGTATSKIEKGGWAISDINITSDTTWKQLPAPASIDTVIELNFGGNSFKTADFALNSDVAGELDYVISKIREMGGTIDSVKIISSTDTEFISYGNEELAKRRGGAVKDYINSLGVDAPIDDSEIHPESGADVVSAEQYKSANTNLKQIKDIIKKSGGNPSEEQTKALEDAQQQLDDYHVLTEPYRTEIVTIYSHISPEGADEMVVSDVVNKLEMTLIKKKDDYSGGKYKAKGGDSSTKKFKCKIQIPKGKSIPCETFK